jgi:hypothetical protein
MALQTLNTIQSGVQSSYSDKYIKQALSNLGQRTGTKGDSIINQDFKITDIKNYNVNLNDVDYICIAYNPLSGDMDCIYNDNVLQPDQSNMFASLDIVDIVEVNNVPIVEYIGDWNDLNSVRIYKNHINNSYFVSGVCLNNGVATEIIALEFDENTNTLLNGISLVVDNNFVSFIVGQTIDGNIQIKDNVKFQIQNSNNLTFNTLYTDVAKFVSVNDIIDYITDGVVVTETDADIQYNKTKFTYYINILPNYIKNLYNESVYFADNSYVGLKKYIIREFVKRLYVDSGYDASDNNVFEVYFNKDYSFACLVNSTTNGIYVSYDILVKFANSDIDTNNLQYIEATSNIDDKIAAYKFYVTYLENDKYVDEILVDKLYVLPYIKENDRHEHVWVLNDNETDIRTSGKDAGNPNIIMMSYVKAFDGDQVSYSTDDSININVLHSYEETDGNSSFKDLLLQYTNVDGIQVSFNYFLPTLVPVRNSNYFKFDITLPNVNKIIEENATFDRIVKNTLLMTFVDVNISTDEKYNTVTGENNTLGELLHGNVQTVSYITVYWHIVNNNGTYTWEPILNPALGDGNSDNLPVLDLGSMFSFTDFVDYYVHSLMTPDEYLFSWLVFDPISKQLKNAVSDDVLNENLIHLVLKPDTADYYSTSTSTVKYDGYENNLNFAPKFLKGKGLDSQSNPIDIIEYKNGSEILSIKDTPDEYSNVEKFFALKDRRITAISKVNNDFVPNADGSNKYPTFDLREMLTLNQSLLNRLNIISIAPDKRVYNAYFGHATTGVNETDYDYDVLAIGSYRQNNNMNSNITLTNSANNFSEYDRIRMDLPVFHKEQAVYDKIVLKKMQGEGMYFATISVSNSNPFYIKTYKDSENNETFKVTKTTKYMKYNIPTGDNNLFINDGFYCKKFKSFNAAKYLNDMDKYKLIVLDDDPQYPRNAENSTYKEDGYVLIKISEDSNFSNIKMLGGFDNFGGDASSLELHNKNSFTSFICYFQDAKYITDLKDNYGPKTVDETGYNKNKLWLKLVNVQEIVTGSKYIQ